MGLHIVPAVLAMVSIGLTVAGLYFAIDGTGLYALTLKYNIGTTAVTTTSTTGIYDRCFIQCSTPANGTELCSANFCWEATLVSNCTNAQEGRQKWMGVQYSLFGATAIQLAIFFTIVGNGASLALLRIIISALGFLAYSAFAACVALYFYFWVACSQTVCEDILAGGVGTDSTVYTGCSQGFVWPFWLIIAAGGLSLITAILSCVAKASAVPEGSSEAPPPTSAGGNGQQQQQQGGAGAPPAYYAGEDNGQQQQQQQQQDDPDQREDNADDQQEADKADDGEVTKKESYDSGNNGAAAGGVEEDDADLYPIPEGDWVPDEESGMHWSDEQWMYFHRESGQFYDPEADMWYSDEVGDWYKADEYDYEDEEGGGGEYAAEEAEGGGEYQ